MAPAGGAVRKGGESPSARRAAPRWRPRQRLAPAGISEQRQKSRCALARLPRWEAPRDRAHCRQRRRARRLEPARAVQEREGWRSRPQRLDGGHLSRPAARAASSAKPREETRRRNATCARQSTSPPQGQRDLGLYRPTPQAHVAVGCHRRIRRPPPHEQWKALEAQGLAAISAAGGHARR